MNDADAWRILCPPETHPELWLWTHPTPHGTDDVEWNGPSFDSPEGDALALVQGQRCPTPGAVLAQAIKQAVSNG